MKTQYQYLTFVKIGETAVTSRWSCRNTKSGDELGVIHWYPSWRQYCYFPTVQAVYSTGCLKDIADFIEQLKAQRAANNTSDNYQGR